MTLNMAVQHDRTASHLVRAAFVDLLEDPCLLVDTERARNVKSSLEELLLIFDEEPTKFNYFSENWTSQLVKIVSESTGDARSVSTSNRDKLWKGFYVHISLQLNKMWVEFLSSEVLSEDPFLIQAVARKLFERILKKELIVSSSEQPPAPVSDDEANAIRYAGGYILNAIRKELANSDAPSSKLLVQFIVDLNLEDDSAEETYLEYTTCWIKKINRGGLFMIPDHFCEMLIRMEEIQRIYLKDVSVHTAGGNVKVDIDRLQKTIIKDDDIQFWWSMVCATLDSDLAYILLGKIVKLWITIRGFSYASAIVEQYKKCIDVTLKRKRALRKDLKKD